MGIMVGIFTAYVQSRLYQIYFIKEITFFDYGKVNIFLFGFLISFGAVFGDLAFAFLKRRLKMRPGQFFAPFDQTNYVLGAFLFLSLLLKLNLSVWLAIFILTFFLHIIFNRLGFWLGLSRSKW